MTRKTARFQKDDVFFSKKHNKMFIVKDAWYIDYLTNGSKSQEEDIQGVRQVEDWLYECAYLGENKRHVRYYEKRLNREAVPMDNTEQSIDMVKTLYGRNES